MISTLKTKLNQPAMIAQPELAYQIRYKASNNTNSPRAACLLEAVPTDCSARRHTAAAASTAASTTPPKGLSSGEHSP
jgi:hypothetical protein